MKTSITIAVVAGTFSCSAFADGGYGLEDLIAAPFRVVGATLETVGDAMTAATGGKDATDDELATAISVTDVNVLRETMARYKKPLDRVFIVDSAGVKWTPLEYAAVKDNAVAIELLVNKGANPNFKCEGCVLPLYVAIHNGHINAARMLLSKGAYLGSGPLRAARKGYVALVKMFIEEWKTSVDSYWDYDDAADSGFMLAAAAGNGKLEVCKYLISKGATVDLSPKSKDGSRFYSAIEMASKNGHLDVVMYFYEVAGSKMLYAAQKVADKKNQSLVAYLDKKVNELEAAKRAQEEMAELKKRQEEQRKNKEKEQKELGFWEQFLLEMATPIGEALGEELGNALFN